MIQGQMKEALKTKHSIEDLNRMFSDGQGVDQELFAEQRSNILLYSGEHYNRRYSPFYKRIRDSKELATEQKLRLTKNHIQFICDVYVNNIVAPNPGIGFTPKNEKEVHDQKVADMHHSVWRDAHAKYNIDDKIDDWADQFVQIGEVFTKIYYDKNKGKTKGYEQKVNEEGMPLFIDQMGVETPSSGEELGVVNKPLDDLDRPIYQGAFCFDDIYGFNLIRPADCKDLRLAPWLAEQKMVPKKDLLIRFKDKKEFLQATDDQTYMVFDSSRGGYTKTSDQVYVIEYYFRPCHEYPNGYYYITTKEGILAEGELPGGIFPIVAQPFRKFPTTPRGRGPIKTMRPYQAEINRSGSKMAEHQITLGDDKLLIQNGTKVSSGMSLPGIRSVSYTGMAPTILQGRDGSQYLNYMNSQISELYQVMGVKEVADDNNTQMDPYVMLFRSARDKKKFQRYIKRFEKFLIDIVKTYLSLAKAHLPDDELIYVVGRTEQVNIPEFRELKDICYEITVEAQSEDIESKLGKQIVINHALQYIGNKLDSEDIGKLMRQMPYCNFDESFNDFTLDYDNSVNDILALDRGERPPVNQYDNHVYCIKRLVSRMRQADFKYLSPQIQKSYSDKISIHQEFEAQKQIALQRAAQGIIPTGGYLVVADLYVPDPKNPSKSSRVRLPSESVQWLIKQLEVQNSGLAPISELNGGAQEQIANKVNEMSAQSTINQANLSRQPGEMGQVGLMSR